MCWNDLVLYKQVSGKLNFSSTLALNFTLSQGQLGEMDRQEKRAKSMI